MDSEESGRSVRLVASDGDAGANPEGRIESRDDRLALGKRRLRNAGARQRRAIDRYETDLVVRRSGKHRRNLTEFEAGGSR
jgi:hypothetical protein